MSEEDEVTEDLHGMRKTEAPKVTKELDTILGESNNHVANPKS